MRMNELGGEKGHKQGALGGEKGHKQGALGDSSMDDSGLRILMRRIACLSTFISWHSFPFGERTLALLHRDSAHLAQLVQRQ